jgi:parallel beta-helix repeat protein
MAAGLTRWSSADEGPTVVNPRATHGDERSEPAWQEQFTLTVGQSDADLVGKDDRVLQAAVDYVARLGGGTVKVLPGTYVLRNSVYLPSGIRLVGSGAETVLTKIASQNVKLAEDSDWYDQEVTLAEGADFRVGDAVVLRADNPHDNAKNVIKRTIVARSGNRLKLDKGLLRNCWLSGDPTCASVFPLLTSESTQDVAIENLTLDGNRQQNEHLDGNYTGCIFLQFCNRYSIRHVTARNYNGDGISFQVCHDVLVQDCDCHDNADLGVHPGSGSQRPRILDNRLRRNTIGLFWCWGVKFGLAERNMIEDNRDYGISIGHNDNNNVMRDNEVRNSGKVGILFRDDAGGQDFWPNRNVVEHNRIVNSGGPDGVGIDILGRARDLTIGGNEIREERGPANRIGIRIAAGVGSLQMPDNRFIGLARAVLDSRTTG